MLRMRALKVRTAKRPETHQIYTVHRGWGDTYGNYRGRVTRAFLPGRIEADHLYVVVFSIKRRHIRVNNDIRNRAQ